MSGSSRAAWVVISGLAAAGCATTDTGVPVPASTPPVAVIRPLEQVSSDSFAFQGALSQGGLVLGTAPAGTASIVLDGKPVTLGHGGRFLLGFDRDQGPVSILEATGYDGARLRTELRIAPRKWDIQSLPTLRRGTTPTPEFLARRKLELEQIRAARAKQSDSSGWEQRFVWPAVGRISGLFGAQRIYAGEPGAPHGGVDVARPEGAPVVSPADGVVILATPNAFSLEGRLLMIDHGMGLNSAFLHLSRIDVVEGQRVSRGQHIATIGATGRATGPHLHWGMKWRDVRIDPLLVAGPMPGTEITSLPRHP